jgi:hypothetical protein
MSQVRSRSLANTLLNDKGLPTVLHTHTHTHTHTHIYTHVVVRKWAADLTMQADLATVNFVPSHMEREGSDPGGRGPRYFSAIPGGRARNLQLGKRHLLS